MRRLLGAGDARRQASRAVLVPCGWLMVELVRSWQYLGGPWGLLGASQWQVAPALRLASVGGVWLVSFLVVLVNTCVTALVVAAGGAAARGGGAGRGGGWSTTAGVAVGAAGPSSPGRPGSPWCSRGSSATPEAPLRPRGAS